MRTFSLLKLIYSKKGCCVEIVCPFCLSSPEIVNHLFLHCFIAKMVWFALPSGTRVSENSVIVDWWEACLDCKDVYFA